MVCSPSPSIPVNSQQNIPGDTFSQNIFMTKLYSPMVCSPSLNTPVLSQQNIPGDTFSQNIFMTKLYSPMVCYPSPSIPVESQQNISRVTFSQNIFILFTFKAKQHQDTQPFSSTPVGSQKNISRVIISLGSSFPLQYFYDCQFQQAKQPMIRSPFPSIPVESQQNVSRATPFSKDIFMTVYSNTTSNNSQLFSYTYLISVSLTAPRAATPCPLYLSEVSKMPLEPLFSHILL